MRFNLRKTDKAGGNIYAAEGIRASVYVNKSIFKDGKAPQSLEIAVPEGQEAAFAEPGAVRPVVSSAEAIQKAQEAAAKAQAAAEKAAARAAKAAARAAKLVPAQGESAQA